VSQLDSKSTKPTGITSSGILVSKPRTTVYTALLGVALAAISIGCLLLFAELWRYGFALHH
jgi:hypothetical protein